jgi:hypothetical protein
VAAFVALVLRVVAAFFAAVERLADFALLVTAAFFAAVERLADFLVAGTSRPPFESEPSL